MKRSFQLTIILVSFLFLWHCSMGYGGSTSQYKSTNYGDSNEGRSTAYYEPQSAPTASSLKMDNDGEYPSESDSMANDKMNSSPINNSTNTNANNPNQPNAVDQNPQPNEEISEYRNFAYAGSAFPKDATDDIEPIDLDKVKRIVIYTGYFGLRVINIEETSQTLTNAAGKLGGYLQSSTLNQIDLRIPSAYFEDFTKIIKRLGILYDSRINSQDVTEEFIDTMLRLNNKLLLRQRLATLLEKATKIEDSLAIEKELSRVTEEIERMKGRLKYLMNQAKFSTITIYFVQDNYAPSRKYYNGPFDWINGVGLEDFLAF